MGAAVGGTYGVLVAAGVFVGWASHGIEAGAEMFGMIEVHGLGIRRLEYEPMAAVGWVIDLASSDGGRMPAKETRETTVLGATLPRLPVAAGTAALPLVLAWLRTTAAVD